MISDCVSKHLIVGDALIDNESLSSVNISNTFIYEVLRVVDGAPIFLKDHYERLSHSAQTLGFGLGITYKSFAERLARLTEADVIENADLKVIVEYDNSRATNFYAFEMAHNYPTAEMYANGVEVATFAGEREDPNVKKNLAVRHRADEFIRCRGVYEIVYLNNEGYLLEGSRSNVFFVKGTTIYTAPSNKVLLGITRKYVRKIIADLGLTLVEGNVRADEMPTFDGAFLTSTPFNVLPIAHIDNIAFDAHNKFIVEIMKAFDKEVENSKDR